MRINSKCLFTMTMIYIYLPVFLFIAGWTRVPVAMITIVVCLLFLSRMWKQLGEEKTEYLTVQVWTFLLGILIIAAVCICIGLGGWFSQSGDWYKHNAVLHDLIDYSWPVIYREREESMLTYYIGQYLLPALFGKITGSFRFAEIVTCIWGIGGVFLVYLQLLMTVRAKGGKKQLLTLFMLLLFCGMLLPCQTVLKQIYGDVMYSAGDYHWLSVESIRLQYRSNLVMLRWVFPQCIVPWLVVLLFWRYREKTEYYILFMLPVLLFASFSFVGIAAMGIGLTIWHFIYRGDKKEMLRRCFSLSNLLPGILLGGIFFFYFWGNVKEIKPAYMSFAVQSYSMRTIWVYIIFCLFMFGIYAGIIWQENKKNPCYYLAVLQLLIIPFFKMGLYNDFVMCTSIPALFLLELFVIQFLLKETGDETAEKCEKNNIRNVSKDAESRGMRKGILIVCLCIGIWYPVLELSDNIMAKTPGNMSADGYGTMANFSDRNNTDIQDDLKYNYYTYDLEKTFFYRYLAKHH